MRFDRSSEQPAPAPSRSATAGPGHGFFGWAVRLMSNVPFRTKAWLISLAFALPLAMLLYSYVTTKKELLDITRLELQGVTYSKAILEVTRNARLLRVAAIADAAKPTGRTAKAREDLNAAIAKLDPVHAEFGASMGTADELAAAKKVLADTPDTYETLFKAFAATSKNVSAWHLVLDAAVDGSGLSLDPDADSYYAMQVSLVGIPRMYEQLGRVINLSAAVSAAGQGAQLAAAEVARSDALTEAYLNDMKSSANKVILARPELKDRFDLTEIIKQINVLRDLATDDVGAGGEATSVKILGKGTEVRKLVADYQNQAIAALTEMLVARESAIKRSMAIAVGTALVGVLIAVYLFYGFAYAMTGAMRAVTKRVNLVAEGDLSHKLHVFGKDELASILQRTGDMSDSLVHTIGQVAASADQVASVSDELRRGTSDLAERTENTASQLQKTASSMEEMQATVGNTAHATQEAAKLATNNAQLAAQGGKVIGEVVHTMQRIQDSAKTINDIVGLIDSIAFQTNILALNAAVEAARAGEQGKGFAVVAAEVRNLAQRSAAAAKDIKTLIGQSVEQTQNGVRVVGDAGKTMQDIVEAAARMNDLLSDISRATSEQAQGIGLVNAAIAELDQMTQQNAALVEETMASATMMNDTAMTMVAEVGRFKLPQD